MKTGAQHVVSFLTSGSFLWLGLVHATLSSAAKHFDLPERMVSDLVSQPESATMITGGVAAGRYRWSDPKISLTRHQSFAPPWTSINDGGCAGILQPEAGDSIAR